MEGGCFTSGAFRSRHRRHRDQARSGSPDRHGGSGGQWCSTRRGSWSSTAQTGRASELAEVLAQERVVQGPAQGQVPEQEQVRVLVQVQGPAVLAELVVPEGRE